MWHCWILCWYRAVVFESVLFHAHVLRITPTSLKKWWIISAKWIVRNLTTESCVWRYIYSKCMDFFLLCVIKMYRINSENTSVREVSFKDDKHLWNLKTNLGMCFTSHFNWYRGMVMEMLTIEPNVQMTKSLTRL